MMPIKIQCGCGQKYAFDTEPICGRMPASINCPVCGQDGTSAVNECIAFKLASERSARDEYRNIVMIFAVLGCMIAGLAGVAKAFVMTDGFNVFLCLLASVGTFGTALCVYFWKR